ncbi:GH1 family beta-glucosidase [Amycolatopsis roodepoortensis]|uniref:GH1 family beta-glucosidase n=1 Tax=Amycolatopsis roodepoortensis TaxID=700274 RepID=UPI00214A8B9A|nr:GH1 family beta-glucosidase [Amycolatopsis roodepoortensis]UUV28950.1 GH1 family beta-glucosidase [Amycolatopsis roodepoortensis]
MTGDDELIGTLPPDFRWGVGSSAYQVEGAVAEDGRTPSIWDTWARSPWSVDNGDTGEIACDHYHRMPSDVALLKELGVDTYRFSVSWPRVQPRGRGGVNPAGIAFYDRLVDELLNNGIDPWLTLYHWDLPQHLEDAGGWPARDTAVRFADYAMLVFERLSDRVRHWTTLSEPWCTAMHGYVHGVMAPGRRDAKAGMAAAHHLLLGHGLAVRRMRELAPPGTEFGITLNLSTADPATPSEADRAAARFEDGLGTRFYLDSLVHGRYPEDVLETLARQGIRLPSEPWDPSIIAAPLDFLGVDYYFGTRYSGVEENGDAVEHFGMPAFRKVPFGAPSTELGWEILPHKLTELLVRISRDYPGLPLYVTENGAAFADVPDETGFVRDDDRAGYLSAHIAATAAARRAGADVRGYFAWSFLDSFEWAYGYAKRLGLVRVDRETQARTIKQSGLVYRDIVERVRGGRR